MRNEDLEHAWRRAHAAALPLRDRQKTLRDVIERFKRRQTELEAEGRPDEADEYAANAKRLYGCLMEQGSLAPRLKAADELERALKGLPSSWIVGMPGVGTGGAHFFVRSYRIEDGKPAAYDPFWIETCIKEPHEDLERLMELHARWLAGTLRTAKGGPSDPLIGVAKPFGREDEAARVPCAACGASAYVVGWKELTHWGAESEDDDWPWRQSLYVLCLTCPRLTLLAERADAKPPKLHL